ncbi:SDR family oxidoreductase [Streptomyces sp. NPDC001530]|uniref:SDR family oxidoreductase n=1 Tax=Streptomyces sp. NPDC001530 TaxID=3364582 RepID=UPI003676F2DF
MNSPIAVIGGTGRVGRIVTRQLIERGETVRVIGRSTLRARRHLPPLAQFFLGDMGEPETLRTPLHGCAAVVHAVEPGPDSPAGAPETGVVNTLAALLGGAASGSPRFVLLGRAGEDAVRASGLPYTVVRPGRRTALDVAEACVQALFTGLGPRHPTPDRALV